MERSSSPESFDCRYRAARYVTQVSLASEHRVAVNQDSARPAGAFAASRLGSRKAEACSKPAQEAGSRLGVEVVNIAVDNHRVKSHGLRMPRGAR
jgi:hypothetical protein